MSISQLRDLVAMLDIWMIVLLLDVQLLQATSIEIVLVSVIAFIF